MAKKTKKNQAAHSNGAVEKKQFSDRTESIFKYILRTMTWIVGVASVTILVLPLFEKPLLDQITRVIFSFGLLTLLLFTVIEFASKPLKNVIEFFISREKSRSV